MLKLLADPNIAQVSAAFAEFGEVRLVPGRAWEPRIVAAADVLLVRSVTRVDARLLAGSRVQFVGSATSGIDHVDLDFLQRAGIGFASAPGSNANSVAEYVISALLVVLGPVPAWQNHVVGIVGYGHVGKRVHALLNALGLRCLINDPYLQDQGCPGQFVAFEEVLAADILSVHVPLTSAGRYPTRNLLGADALARLRDGAVLVNTARGGVVDEAALLSLLNGGKPLRLVIDCWEREPDINVELLRRTAIGTPHIAGYSVDGKLLATEMLHAALCQHLRREARWPGQRSREAAGCCLDADQPDIIRRAVFASYDARQDDGALRRMLGLDAEARGRYFDGLRNQYRVRREFGVGVSIRCGGPAPSATLAALGFNVLRS